MRGHRDTRFPPVDAPLCLHVGAVFLCSRLRLYTCCCSPIICTQDVFGYTLDEFLVTPSRLSAEAPVRAERDALLARVASEGYIDDYEGVRISKDGKRFLIKALVWNVVGQDGEDRGQAALFDRREIRDAV